MKIKPQTIQSKSGKTFTIRSPEEQDAAAYLDFLIQENTQTYFMANYPEELQRRTIEEEAKWINDTNQSDKSFTIMILDGDKLIGSSGVAVFPKEKMCHRGYLGIGFLQEYCNLGLGTSVINICIQQSRINGFEQLELDVFEDNSRALHLYQKSGFKITGVHPRAFKLRDGTYHDAIDMLCIL